MGMKGKNGWVWLLVVACAVVLLLLATGWGVYSYAQGDAFGQASALHPGLGVDRLEYLGVSPSLRHGFHLFWRIHYRRQEEFMPGDIAVWRLYPREVVFTK